MSVCACAYTHYLIVTDVTFSVSGDTQSIKKRIIFENNYATLTRELVVRNGMRECTEFTTYFRVTVILCLLCY